MLLRTSTRFSLKSYAEPLVDDDDDKRLVSRSLRNAMPLGDPNPRTLFAYIPENGSAITITSNELVRLPEGVYLNDTLIDFNLKYMAEHVSPETRARTHIFSSFFYRKLKEADLINGQEVKSPVNIFEKTFIFTPINEQYPLLSLR